jgi:phenylalanyl-tRNA synthetase alpha chain
MNVKVLQEQFESDKKSNLSVDELYLKYFSKKKGLLTTALKSIKNLSPQERKTIGKDINSLRIEVKNYIEELEAKPIQKDKNLNFSIPDFKPNKVGQLHPSTEFINDLVDFFKYYGFSVYEGPEIETPEYNFRKLNLPEGHPATDLQDTLYIQEPGVLLRTHTSSVETRALTNENPPIRIVIPGKCYRNETPTPTNTPFFHQFQGVLVDKGVNLGHLKDILTKAHQKLFGEDVILRFRYKYYPEVSPGLGVDMQCRFCEGSGCNVCKQRGYIEVLGAGMIHYNTLKMCGIDTEEYTGYAFGMGLDRLIIQKYGVDDIRKLYYGGILYK